jgi:predicted DNA-binding transcriptional regulator YafY
MNRRGFLRAAGATGLLLAMHGPADGSIFGSKVSMETLIRQALAGQRRVKFNYHDHARVVEPHALGFVTEGRLAIVAWQVSGGSESGTYGWRTFLLKEITGLKLTRDTFKPRLEYRPETTQLKSVLAEVSSKSAEAGGRKIDLHKAAKKQRKAGL